MSNVIVPENQIKSDSEKLNLIIENIEQILLGKRAAVKIAVLTLISKGHILIEDMPGVGKTTLAFVLAKSINCEFSRIQFTPDLMPSDITGFSVYNEKDGAFEFRKGAVMSNLVLADEINRATPRTQSALLEVMEEHQVTVDNHTYAMEQPFMVIATQNPTGSFGTYPLPEAQIDRFMARISIGYPSDNDEIEMLKRADIDKKQLLHVIERDEVLQLQKDAEHIFVSDLIYKYISNIVRKTRDSEFFNRGASPRASISLLSMSRGSALLAGRNYVSPDDVKLIAPYVLGHRVEPSRDMLLKSMSEIDALKKMIENIPVPEDLCGN